MVGLNFHVFVPDRVVFLVPDYFERVVADCMVDFRLEVFSNQPFELRASQFQVLWVVLGLDEFIQSILVLQNMVLRNLRLPDLVATLSAPNNFPLPLRAAVLHDLGGIPMPLTEIPQSNLMINKVQQPLQMLFKLILPDIFDPINNNPINLNNNLILQDLGYTFPITTHNNSLYISLYTINQNLNNLLKQFFLTNNFFMITPKYPFLIAIVIVIVVIVIVIVVIVIVIVVIVIVIVHPLPNPAQLLQIKLQTLLQHRHHLHNLHILTLIHQLSINKYMIEEFYHLLM